MTTFDEYSKFCESTDISGHEPFYYDLGIAGEAGEVAEKTKKLYRDHHGVMSEEYKMAVSKELGDVLWYVDRKAASIGLSLEVVAKLNMLKLKERQAKNKLQGSGDDRENEDTPEG